MKTEIGKGVWNESEGGVVRSKKQTEWETVDHWHARGGGLLSNDWLEDKEKQDLITSGTCVTPLVASRPWNDCLQKNQRFSLNKWSKLDHPWWLTTQRLWGMGQLWKIITSCMIQWDSNWMNKLRNEHPAGVAPPCRPPPAGCSEFPSRAF